jgi:hypothetical protein
MFHRWEEAVPSGWSSSTSRRFFSTYSNTKYSLPERREEGERIEEEDREGCGWRERERERERERDREREIG